MYQVIATEKGRRVVLAGGFWDRKQAKNYAEKMKFVFNNHEIEVEKIAKGTTNRE